MPIYNRDPANMLGGGYQGQPPGMTPEEAMRYKMINMPGTIPGFEAPTMGGQGLGGQLSPLGSAQPLGLERMEGGVSPMQPLAETPAPTQVAPSPAAAIGAPGTTPLSPAQTAWEETSKGLKWLAGAGKSMGAAIGKPEVLQALSQLGMAMSSPGEAGYEMGKMNIEGIRGRAYEQYVSDIEADREPTTGRMLPPQMLARAQQQVNAKRVAERLERMEELDIERAETRPSWEEQHKMDIERAGEPSRVAGGFAAGRAADAAMQKKIDFARRTIVKIAGTVDPGLAGQPTETIIAAMQRMLYTNQTFTTSKQGIIMQNQINFLKSIDESTLGLEAEDISGEY